MADLGRTRKSVRGKWPEMLRRFCKRIRSSIDLTVAVFYNEKRMKTFWQLLAAGTALLNTAGVWANDGYAKTPQSDPPTPWGAISWSIVLLIGVAAVAFKNAKRSHLD